MKKRRVIDLLCIPDSRKEIRKQRMQRAKQEEKVREIRKTVMMKGKDSEEDILILGKKLKGGERIGIVTFPLHFKEYQDIIRRAKQQKKFPRGVKVEGILTRQTGKEFVYGELGLEEEKLFEKKVDYLKNRKKGILEFVKRIMKKILNFI